MRILYVLLLTTTSKGTLMVKISVHQSCSYVISLTECNSGTIQKIAHLELTLWLSSKYSVIQKDGLNFVSIYFKIRTSDKQIWYGLNSKQHLNTRQPVGCGIPSSLLALRVDLRGLRSKLSSIRLTFSSDTRGWPELLPLHRQPICSNWWLQRQMLFHVGGWMLKRRRNARCTAVADSVLMNARTQKILCCIVAILLSTDAAARLCARRAL